MAAADSFELIGNLLVNSDYEICYVDIRGFNEIALFHYIADARALFAVDKSDKEHMYGSEIPHSTHRALISASSILVVQLDPANPSAPRHEAKVPLRVSGLLTS